MPARRQRKVEILVILDLVEVPAYTHAVTRVKNAGGGVVACRYHACCGSVARSCAPSVGSQLLIVKAVCALVLYATRPTVRSVRQESGAKLRCEWHIPEARHWKGQHSPCLAVSPACALRA